MKYYTVQGWQGSEVVKEDERGRRLYLTRESKGAFYWTTDFTYSKKFSQKTAEKKAAEAERRER